MKSATAVLFGLVLGGLGEVGPLFLASPLVIL